MTDTERAHALAKDWTDECCRDVATKAIAQALSDVRREERDHHLELIGNLTGEQFTEAYVRACKRKLSDALNRANAAIARAEAAERDLAEAVVLLRDWRRNHDGERKVCTNGSRVVYHETGEWLDSRPAPAVLPTVATLDHGGTD